MGTAKAKLHLEFWREKIIATATDRQALKNELLAILNAKKDDFTTRMIRFNAKQKELLGEDHQQGIFWKTHVEDRNFLWKIINYILSIFREKHPYAGSRLYNTLRTNHSVIYNDKKQLYKKALREKKLEQLYQERYDVSWSCYLQLLKQHFAEKPKETALWLYQQIKEENSTDDHGAVAHELFADYLLQQCLYPNFKQPDVLNFTIARLLFLMLEYHYTGGNDPVPDVLKEPGENIQKHILSLYQVHPKKQDHPVNALKSCPRSRPLPTFLLHFIDKLLALLLLQNACNPQCAQGNVRKQLIDICAHDVLGKPTNALNLTGVEPAGGTHAYLALDTQRQFLQARQLLFFWEGVAPSAGIDNKSALEKMYPKEVREKNKWLEYIVGAYLPYRGMLGMMSGHSLQQQPGTEHASRERNPSELRFFKQSREVIINRLYPEFSPN